MFVTPLLISERSSRGEILILSNCLELRMVRFALRKNRPTRNNLIQSNGHILRLVPKGEVVQKRFLQC